MTTMKGHSWDETGELVIEYAWNVHSQTWVDDDLEPARISHMIGTNSLQGESFDLIINFRSKGFYEPAVMYPNDKAHPEESDEERTVESVHIELLDDHRNRIEFHGVFAQSIFEFYEDQINAVELETDNDGPEL